MRKKCKRFHHVPNFEPHFSLWHATLHLAVLVWLSVGQWVCWSHHCPCPIICLLSCCVSGLVVTQACSYVSRRISWFCSKSYKIHYRITDWPTDQQIDWIIQSAHFCSQAVPNDVLNLWVSWDPLLWGFTEAGKLGKKGNASEWYDGGNRYDKRWEREGMSEWVSKWASEWAAEWVERVSDVKKIMDMTRDEN